MSDRELESLAKRPRIEKGLCRWTAWEAERTGFGLGFRRATSVPSFVPLPFSSDHYVDPRVDLRPNEVASGLDLYVSWNKEKVERLASAGVNAIHFPHPWLFLGLRESPTTASERGTLVFWPHSHGTSREELPREGFLGSLGDLPTHYRPLTICLQSYDILLGTHRELREWGFPLVTAGDVTSQRYPFRFAELVAGHKFTLGPNIGSHVYYSIWMRKPFLLFEPQMYAWKVEDVTTGKWRHVDSIDSWLDDTYPDREIRKRVDSFRASLMQIKPEPSPAEMSFVEENLGLGSATSQADFRKVVWRHIAERFRSRLPLLA